MQNNKKQAVKSAVSLKKNCPSACDVQYLAAQPSAKHAAVTIISKNYFSYAQTLATSYKKYYNDHDFIIILVDKPSGLLKLGLHDDIEILSFETLGIPNIVNFIYRYTIVEINTAVKPYALSHLFATRKYKSIIYFDPDIVIYSKLTTVYSALNEVSIVLTPHIQSPFEDDMHPSELTILQSGTYNLGFIALKNTPITLEFLEWWKQKLYTDCIIDIERGLFVDQKWIDLALGYFPDHQILYDKTCNVAYWNLHEREITYKDNKWFINGKQLTFYHFSGFSPLSPTILSKHQNRHNLRTLPALKALTDDYAQRLKKNGYAESNTWRYAFSTLNNNVILPLHLVRDVMQWAKKENIDTPNPLLEADKFCAFLFSKGLISDAHEVALIYFFLLKRRKDVARAHPGALSDSSDPGFRAWLKTTGNEEEGLTSLAPFDTRATIANHVRHLFTTLCSHNRTDVLEAYANCWDDEQTYNAFAYWITEFGTQELGLSQEHARALLESRQQITTILNVYFADSNLQKEFPNISAHDQLSVFLQWLNEHKVYFSLTLDGLALFEKFVKARPERIAQMLFLYRQDDATNAPSIYTLDQLLKEKKLPLSPESLANMFACSECIEPIDHVDTTTLAYISPPPFLDEAVAHTFVEKIQTAIQSTNTLINVAGYFNVASGMGESARSMCNILDAQQIAYRRTCLPHARSMHDAIPTRPEIFGWPSSKATSSILVANADSVEAARKFLPKTFWRDKNIGYWVWETEKLPLNFAESAHYFSEIWTPSRYSAAAIEATVDKKVVVVPHVVDIALLEKAMGDRRRFGLPESGMLYGFIFDPQSILERKNVGGLIQAFEKAFSERDNAHLILKINGSTRKSYEFQELRSRIQNPHIIILEKTYNRQDNFDFMASLDVYVSLHRAEGYGLTLAEAMALGKPVIASRYSGNLDFMNDNNSILITTKCIQTDRAYGPYPAGTVWGDPDLEEAAAKMRELFLRPKTHLDTIRRVLKGKKS